MGLSCRTQPWLGIKAYLQRWERVEESTGAITHYAISYTARREKGGTSNLTTVQASIKGRRIK